MIVMVSGKSGAGKDEFALLAGVGPFDRCSAGDVCKHEVRLFLDGFNICGRDANYHGTQEEKLETAFYSTEHVFDHFPYPLKTRIIKATDNRPTAAVTFRDVMAAWARWKTEDIDPMYFVSRMLETLDPFQDYVMTDFRFEAEWRFLRDKTDVLTVRIDRPSTDQKIPSGSIDCLLDDFKHWDYRIYNNSGLRYFRSAAKAVLDDISDKYNIV